jgi:hypothetical protein
MKATGDVLVNEAKLIYYIITFVEGKPTKKGGRKKKESNVVLVGDSQLTSQPIQTKNGNIPSVNGYQNVRMMVYALKSL